MPYLLHKVRLQINRGICTMPWLTEYFIYICHLCIREIIAYSNVAKRNHLIKMVLLHIINKICCIINYCILIYLYAFAKINV